MQPGQFWAVPLSNNRFACGRVIALRFRADGTRDSRGFLAGLLDWVGTSHPTPDSIAGKQTIEQGAAYIRTIVHTGGTVLGYRALELDGIEPDFFLSESPGPGCSIQRGFEVLRAASKHEQRELTVFSTWGYMVIQQLAEHYFG